jgi:hypothetical protein
MKLVLGLKGEKLNQICGGASLPTLFFYSPTVNFYPEGA